MRSLSAFGRPPRWTWRGSYGTFVKAVGSVALVFAPASLISTLVCCDDPGLVTTDYNSIDKFYDTIPPVSL